MVHSTRINDQWSIVFRWMNSGPAQVALTIIDKLSITLYGSIMKIPITPGEILMEEYLKPMEISQNAMARTIGVAPQTINEIVHAQRSITPAMSIRFGAFFGQSDEFWHGLQDECDFRKLTSEKQRLTAGIRPASTLSHIS